MFVVAIAWNDMPVQVRCHIAEAGEIDFMRLHHLAHGTLDSKNCVHHFGTQLYGKVSHFLDVGVPDNAAEAGVIGIVDQYYAAMLTAPEQRFSSCQAEFTIHDFLDAIHRMLL